jgi:hypothetical protein
MFATALVVRLVQLRYFGLFTPFLALAEAAGLLALAGAAARVAGARRRAAAGGLALGVLALGLLVLSAAGVRRYDTGPVREDSRSAVALVQARAERGDVVVLGDPDRVMLWRYYAPEGGRRGPPLAFPALDRDPFPLYRPGALRLDDATLAGIAARGHRVWFLTADDAVTGGPSPEGARLGGVLDRTGERVLRVSFFRVLVELYRPDPGRAAHGP